MEDCKHHYKSGKTAGERCRKNGRHDGYCHRHMKKAVPANIAAAVGVEPAPKAAAFKWSSFRWTLNSNASALSVSEAKVAEFKDVVKFVFSEDNVVEYLRDRTDADPSKNIDSIDCNWHFEIAPGNKSIHAHGIVKLKHHGNYTMLIDRIKAVVSGILGKKVHFNVTASGNADEAWAQYMAKNAAADKV